MSDEEEAVLTENEIQMPEEMKYVSFEDLQKVREKLGTKKYNNIIFGTDSKKKIKLQNFKRENKNRPREMSAKKPVPILKQMVPVKKIISRDPRFDSLCGTFDSKAFKHSYAFLSELKQNDLETLKKELKETTDPKTIKKIKYLIQRFENQLREEKRQKQKEENKRQEKKELLESIREKGKPMFKKKSEKKVFNLISQYEELKKLGKLSKHMKRQRRKNKNRTRMEMEME